MNNYKNKRKSMAPESRIHLNHSMVPPGGLPYEESGKRSSESLQLPELPSKPSQLSHQQPQVGSISY